MLHPRTTPISKYVDAIRRCLQEQSCSVGYYLPHTRMHTRTHRHIRMYTGLHTHTQNTKLEVPTHVYTHTHTRTFTHVHAGTCMSHCDTQYRHTQCRCRCLCAPDTHGWCWWLVRMCLGAVVFGTTRFKMRGRRHWGMHSSTTGRSHR